jgi:hypothetical protein
MCISERPLASLNGLRSMDLVGEFVSKPCAWSFPMSSIVNSLSNPSLISASESAGSRSYDHFHVLNLLTTLR